MLPELKTVKVSRPLKPREQHLDSIARWAMGLPESAWTPGAPSLSERGYFAVKTLSGRILTGTHKSFSRPYALLIAAEPKYGPIVAHVQAGE